MSTSITICSVVNEAHVSFLYCRCIYPADLKQISLLPNIHTEVAVHSHFIQLLIKVVYMILTATRFRMRAPASYSKATGLDDATPPPSPETTVIWLSSKPPNSVDKNSNFTLQIIIKNTSSKLDGNKIKLTKAIQPATLLRLKQKM